MYFKVEASTPSSFLLLPKSGQKEWTRTRWLWRDNDNSPESEPEQWKELKINTHHHQRSPREWFPDGSPSWAPPINWTRSSHTAMLTFLFWNEEVRLGHHIAFTMHFLKHLLLPVLLHIYDSDYTIFIHRTNMRYRYLNPSSRFIHGSAAAIRDPSSLWIWLATTGKKCCDWIILRDGDLRPLFNTHKQAFPPSHLHTTLPIGRQPSWVGEKERCGDEEMPSMWATIWLSR